MNSRLYTGTVSHARSTPARNVFRYRVYFCYLDLAELEELDAGLRRFSHNGRALVTFRDADHGPRDGSPLRPWVDALLARAGVDLEGGRVCILSIPRVMGGRFYPISLWYCFHADGTPLAVLAEVQNTFRDHHNYLLHHHGEPIDWSERPTAAKAFYVSPFVQPEDVLHEFAFSEPADSLSASVFDHIDGSTVLTASLSLHAEDLTDANLARAVLRLGPMSARALVLIHWQALKLLFKRVPFVDQNVHGPGLISDYSFPVQPFAGEVVNLRV